DGALRRDRLPGEVEAVAVPADAPGAPQPCPARGAPLDAQLALAQAVPVLGVEAVGGGAAGVGLVVCGGHGQKFSRAAAFQVPSCCSQMDRRPMRPSGVWYSVSPTQVSPSRRTSTIRRESKIGRASCRERGCVAWGAAYGTRHTCRKD